MVLKWQVGWVNAVEVTRPVTGRRTVAGATVLIPDTSGFELGYYQGRGMTHRNRRTSSLGKVLSSVWGLFFWKWWESAR